MGPVIEKVGENKAYWLKPTLVGHWHPLLPFALSRPFGDLCAFSSAMTCPVL
jgi:hypothetical protein